MAKLYGLLDNRLEEGRNYNDDGLIHEGDDITAYYWSDRNCYFVTKVIDQKHIFVHKYHVCADHSKKGGMGHQNWKYFKTCKDENEYLNDCIDKGLLQHVKKYDTTDVREYDDEEWVYRYRKWMQAFRYDKEKWQRCLRQARLECNEPDNEEKVNHIARWMFGLDDEGFNKVMEGKEVIRYYDLRFKVSFGVRDYHYDWEF